MKKPKMIIFDYGQTLVNETSFDVLEGTKAVLSEASNNPNNIPVEVVQNLATDLNKDIGRYGSEFEKHSLLEVHNRIFQRYLYEYFDIELTKSPEEVERIFKNAALTMEPTKGIKVFLQYLKNSGIRTSVISNTSFSENILQENIKECIPSHSFDFIIASSEYIFRKPHKRIFELALRKAKLESSDVWYCGDNAVCDVDGASDCGIFPVWYKGAIHDNNKSVPKKKWLEISDWNELIDIINNI